MPENENQLPVPSKQTSSVPLKKETVRVTLKAADAPPAVPSATVPMAPPVRPPVPGGGAPSIPSAPTPTIPLRAAGMPTASPAPTIRLATSAATGPMRPGGVPTLPKATVQLQVPGQAQGTLPPPSMASTLKVEEEAEPDPKAGLHNILAGVSLVAAVILLICQLMLAKSWISAEDNPKAADGWSQLFQ
jgi:hypothetical protein